MCHENAECSLLGSGGMPRRTFLASAGALAIGSCLAETSYAGFGAHRAQKVTCTEHEPMPGKKIGGQDAFEQSVHAAIGHPAASPINAKRLDFKVGTKPNAVLNTMKEKTVAKTHKVSGYQAAVLNMPAGASPPSGVMPQRLALQKAKLWNRDRTLRFAFVSDMPSGHRRQIEGAIEEWASLITMNLEILKHWVESAEIKIGYRYDGFFSLVGTDALVNSMIAQFGGTSLNIQAGVPNQDYHAVALHEVAHALGCVHEHSQPNASIPWDQNALQRYYGRPPNNWGPDQIRFQILQKYDHAEVNATKFDSESIMLYPVLEELLDHSKPGYRDFITGWNLKLSPLDQEFMQKNYGAQKSVNGEPDEQPPGGKKTGTFNTEGAASLALDAKVDGEFKQYADWRGYKLVVTEADDYVVETIETPVATYAVLELFSASNLTTPLEKNSLGGDHLLNARITRRLDAGTYYVRASHRHNAGKGKYTIYFHKK